MTGKRIVQFNIFKRWLLELAGLLAAFGIIWNFVVDPISRNFIYPHNVYLKIIGSSENNKFTEVLSSDNTIVYPLAPINEGDKVTIRFEFMQRNQEVLDIETISLICPRSAEVEIVNPKGWSWRKSNSIIPNEFFLNFPNETKATNQTTWTLPSLNVIFKNEFNFIYEIVWVINSASYSKRITFFINNTGAAGKQGTCQKVPGQTSGASQSKRSEAESCTLPSGVEGSLL